MDDWLAHYIEATANRRFGKYLGRVVERDDPERLGRLKVTVDSVLHDAVTDWAWPVSPYAGHQIGLLALPAVGDMVWVEFAEGDVQRPLWTGGAWAAPDHESEIPPEAARGYPDSVVLKTASGHVIILSDQAGEERITLRAANGCEVVLEPNAGRITIEADEVHIKTIDGAAQPLATKAFVENVYNKHTHLSHGATTLQLGGDDSFTAVLEAQ